MWVRRMPSVTRLAAWEHAGVLYYVHIGRRERIARHMTVHAIGPAQRYRSIVFPPHAADRVLIALLAARDSTTLTGTVECLLSLREALLN